MKKFITIVFFVLAVACQTSAQKQYTLDACYETALKNNTIIKRAQNQIETNAIDLKTSQYKRMPSLSYDMGHYLSYGKNIDPVTNIFINESFSGGYMDMGLKVAVFSGFNSLFTIKRNKISVQVSEYAKKRTELELLSNITLTYARFLLNKEQAATITGNIETTIKELNIINERIKAGRLSKYEYYTLNARLNSEKAELIAAQNNYSTALQEMKQLLNLPYDDEISIALIDTTDLAEIAATELSSAPFIKAALQSHPAIQQAKMNEQVAQLEERIAKSSLFPSISVGGNLVTNYNANQTNDSGEKITLNKQMNNNIGQNIYINLHVPIFSQRELANRIKKEKINIANAKNTTKDVENEVISNTLKLVNDFNAARLTYKATLAALEQNNLSQKMYEEKYRLGLVSSLELLTAKDILRASNAQYLQSKFELFFRYRLLQLLKSYE